MSFQANVLQDTFVKTKRFREKWDVSVPKMGQVCF